MSATTPRVVVTGLGATTPLGGDVDSTWQAVLAGRSGARPLTAGWVEEHSLPVTFAASLAVPTADVLTKVEVRRNDPSTQSAIVASREAWAHAGAPEVDPERLAVCIGTGIGGVQTLLDQWDTLREKGPRRVFPLAVPMLMANGPSAAVSLELKARAGARTPVSACASGSEAIALGLELIRTGKADVVVAGGTEAAIHPLPIAGFAAMQALSTRNDDPASASRPYDESRDGFVLGEGAAIVVLESAEHAAARGARVHGVVAGAGITSDAYHITAGEPEGEGAARAMSAALADADLTVDDVVHVNAHATSTPVGDLAEANAIRRTLGARTDEVAVTATKSMTGHLLGAAGALETIFTLLALRDRVVPATINLDTMDSQITLDVVRGEHRTLPQGPLAAVNNSFGFGGANVALAVTTDEG